MDDKHTLRNIILFCLVTEHLCLISNEFCSGKSIKDYFDGSTSMLKLDGSNSALLATQTGPLSCTCDVTLRSVADKLEVRLRHDTKTDIKSCYKNLEVRLEGGELEHVFGCSSESIEINDLEEGIRFTLNVFGTSRLLDDAYYLYITPEPGAVLTVQCHAPTQSSTIAPTTSESFTKTSASSTTTKLFVTAESTDTMIVVGVVVGIGLFFLVFISCMLCFIARRKVQKDKPEKSNPTEQPQPQHHNILSRTLTHIYDTMKSNRPLPSIPSSVRKMAPWKIRNQNGSGVYDSIKSNKTNLNKQDSQMSDCSYLEPAAITSISETMAKKNTAEAKKQIAAGTALPASAVRNGVDNTDLAQDTYIHPLSGHEKSEGQEGPAHAQDKYENVPSPQMYMNEQKAKTVNDNTEKQDVADRNINTEIERNGPRYTAMHVSVNQNEGQNGVGYANVEMKECNKNILNATDTSGYMSMNSSEVRKANNLLKKNDSTFPDLIRYTQHDGSIDEPYLKEETGVTNGEKKIEETKNVKTKRYVRDKK